MLLELVACLMSCCVCSPCSLACDDDHRDPWYSRVEAGPYIKFMCEKDVRCFHCVLTTVNCNTRRPPSQAVRTPLHRHSLRRNGSALYTLGSDDARCARTTRSTERKIARAAFNDPEVPDQHAPLLREERKELVELLRWRHSAGDRRTQTHLSSR